MTTPNLSAMMTKYQPTDVQDDLENLTEAIANEDALTVTLSQDPVNQTQDILTFITNNKQVIADQHKQMVKGVADLMTKVTANNQLQSADDAYKAAVSSDDAVLLAQMLAEMNALSAQYRDFLKKNNRTTSVPLRK
jgi:hypothetical protein